MSKALVEKALGSDSEEEAIACLRMARKKGVNLNDLIQPDTKNEILAKEYHAIAYRLQQENQKLLSQLASISSSNGIGHFQNEMTKIKLKKANNDVAFHKFMNWLLGGMFVAAFIGSLIF